MFCLAGSPGTRPLAGSRGDVSTSTRRTGKLHQLNEWMNEPESDHNMYNLDSVYSRHSKKKKKRKAKRSVY
jgi:hypothetical protein